MSAINRIDVQLAPGKKKPGKSPGQCANPLDLAGSGARCTSCAQENGRRDWSKAPATFYTIQSGSQSLSQSAPAGHRGAAMQRERATGDPGSKSP